MGPLSCRRLLLRLDEHSTGNVTLKTLQDLVRDAKMKEIIQLYTSSTWSTSVSPMVPSHLACRLPADPRFPLLIWISDDLALNAPKAAYAQERGISVVQLASTSTAKAWINANRSKLTYVLDFIIY